MKELSPEEFEGSRRLTRPEMDDIVEEIDSMALKIEGDYFVIDLPSGDTEDHLATEIISVDGKDISMKMFLESRMEALGV
ncbi:MAG TPA: hypothetical protein VJJ22_00335 [Candidatus Paceibacterota bacterium]